MLKVSVFVVLCVLGLWAFGGHVDCASHHAPAPSVDCSTLIYSMADCLSFVTNGSKVTKPEGGCCSGLKTVLKTDAECLCEAFKSSSQLGVVLNETKAAGLPTACRLKAPSISNCGLSGVSGAAPALPPKSSASSAPPPTSGMAPAGAPGVFPSGSSGVSAPTPAASAASAASTVSITFAVFVSLVLASCFSL